MENVSIRDLRNNGGKVVNRAVREDPARRAAMGGM